MKILHLDIETAPNLAYVWGLFRQNIAINQIEEAGYTMCWAAKWHKDRTIHFASVHSTSRKRMLRKLHRLLSEADVVVHYNGTKFDIPTINREFVLEGMSPPAPYKQVDLLRVVRSNFRFTSNKLDFVAQALGLGAKVEHVGHALWTRCMNGEEAAWRTMERYNKGDVRLLEKLYNKLLPWISTHPNSALYDPTDRPTCTNCNSPRVQKRGWEYTKTQKYQRYQCTSCSTWLRGRFTEIDPESRGNILVQAK